MNSTPASVTLMGQRISPLELRRRRRDGDLAIDTLVYQQLLADAQAEGAHSEGLLAVNLLWRGPVCSRILSNYFPKDDEQYEVWNEALAAIFRRVSSYDASRSRFSTWVFNQAKYAALNEVRRRRRAKRTEKAAMELRPAMDSDVEVSVFTERERRAAMKAVARLSPNERTMVEQVCILGATYDELFEQLEGTVKREHIRIYVGRAMARLKRFANEELERR